MNEHEKYLKELEELENDRLVILDALNSIGNRIKTIKDILKAEDSNE